MLIEGAPVIQIVGYSTHFRAAQFEDTFDSSICMGSHSYANEAVYAGLPNVSVFDNGSKLRDIFV